MSSIIVTNAKGASIKTDHYLFHTTALAKYQKAKMIWTMIYNLEANA